MYVCMHVCIIDNLHTAIIMYYYDLIFLTVLVISMYIYIYGTHMCVFVYTQYLIDLSAAVLRPLDVWSMADFLRSHDLGSSFQEFRVGGRQIWPTADRLRG